LWLLHRRNDGSQGPDLLAKAGKALWSEVTTTYTLRADELAALEDACAASDMLAEFTKAWTDLGRPYMSKGSMGQEVEHPLIGSIDKQRKARQAFLRQLKLPDDPGTERPNQQRALHSPVGPRLMARPLTPAPRSILSREAEYRQIERHYRDLLTRPCPPEDLGVGAGQDRADVAVVS
jgi:hypothetical protein